MKILAKIKRKSLILGILFVMLIIGIVYAADSYQVNSGAQVTIDEYTVCKKVTNNNALAIFVPTKTAAEWTAFRSYASGVTYAECIYCDDDDGDGYGECPNCGIAAGCTYDGDDCCDTDANAKPGQTSYFTSTNACGSWDYNCNEGGVEKNSNCTRQNVSLSNTRTYKYYNANTCSPSWTYPTTCTTSDPGAASCGVTHSYKTCALYAYGYTGTAGACSYAGKSGYGSSSTNKTCGCH